MGFGTTPLAGLLRRSAFEPIQEHMRKVFSCVSLILSLFDALYESGEVMQNAAIPVWILLLGGFGIVLGLITLGYRVMLTVGTKITEEALVQLIYEL